MPQTERAEVVTLHLKCARAQVLPDSICRTDRARSRGATGVPSPGHVFTRIPQELGKDLCISRDCRK